MVGKAYTMKEMKTIVDYLTEHKGYNEIRGRKMWMDFANSQLTTRTWQSLKETFIKRILPDIHNPYYKLSMDQIRSFQQGCDVAEKEKRNRLKFENIPEDSNSNAENGIDGDQPSTSENFEKEKQAGEDAISGKITSHRRSSADTVVIETFDNTEPSKTVEDNQTKTLKELLTFENSEAYPQSVKNVMDDFATESEQSDTDKESRLVIVESPVKNSNTESGNAQDNERDICNRENEKTKNKFIENKNNADNNGEIIIINDNERNEANTLIDKDFDSKKINNDENGIKENQEITDNDSSAENKVVLENNDCNETSGKISIPIPMNSKSILLNESETNKDSENKNSEKLTTFLTAEDSANNKQTVTKPDKVNSLLDGSDKITQSTGNTTADTLLPNNQEGLDISDKSNRKRSISQDNENNKKQKSVKNLDEEEREILTDAMKTTNPSSKNNDETLFDELRKSVYDTKPDEPDTDTGVHEQSTVKNLCLQSVSLYAEQLNATKYSDTDSHDEATSSQNPVTSMTIQTAMKVEAKLNSNNKVLNSKRDIPLENTTYDRATPSTGNNISLSKTRRERDLAKVFGYKNGNAAVSRSKRDNHMEKIIERHRERLSVMSDSESLSDSDDYVSPPRGKNKHNKKYLKPKSVNIIEEQGGLFVVCNKKIYPLIKNGRHLKNYVTLCENSGSEEDQDYWKKKYLEEKNKLSLFKKILHKPESTKRKSPSPILPSRCSLRKSKNIYMDKNDTVLNLHENDKRKHLKLSSNDKVDDEGDIIMEEARARPVVVAPEQPSEEKRIKITFAKNNEEVHLEGLWPQIHPVLKEVAQIFHGGKKDRLKVPGCKLETVSMNENEETFIISSDTSTPVNLNNDPEIHERVNTIESEIFKQIEELDKSETEKETETEAVIPNKRKRARSNISPKNQSAVSIDSKPSKLSEIEDNRPPKVKSQRVSRQKRTSSKSKENLEEKNKQEAVITAPRITRQRAKTISTPKAIDKQEDIDIDEKVSNKKSKLSHTAEKQKKQLKLLPNDIEKQNGLSYLSEDKVEKEIEQSQLSHDEVEKQNEQSNLLQNEVEKQKNTEIALEQTKQQLLVAQQQLEETKRKLMENNLKNGDLEDTDNLSKINDNKQDGKKRKQNNRKSDKSNQSKNSENNATPEPKRTSKRMPRTPKKLIDTISEDGMQTRKSLVTDTETENQAIKITKTRTRKSQTQNLTAVNDDKNISAGDLEAKDNDNDEVEILYMFPKANGVNTRSRHAKKSTSNKSIITNIISKKDAADSTQGYQDSDISISNMKLQKRRKKLCLTTNRIHNRKCQNKQISRRRSDPIFSQDQSSDSNSSYFVPLRKSQSTLNSEIYKTDSYRLLVPNQKQHVTKMESIDETGHATHQNKSQREIRHFDSVSKDSDKSSTDNLHILVEFGSSSNISLPPSPELSVVENMSVSRELINTGHRQTINEMQLHEVSTKMDCSKYMITDLDVSVPLLENESYELICSSQISSSSQRREVLKSKPVTESLIDNVNSVNIQENSTISESLDQRLRNLLLESAKKMSRANSQQDENAMEVDKSDLVAVTKTKTRNRCSTPRKRNTIRKPKVPQENVIEEEHMETCMYKGRVSCPPIITSLSVDENANQGTDISLKFGKTKQKRTGIKNKNADEKKKKDVIKVKIQKPKGNDLSETRIVDISIYNTSTMSVYTDSGINDTDLLSDALLNDNDSVDLIHNHSETCLLANECVGDSVEFVDKSEAIITLNSTQENDNSDIQKILDDLDNNDVESANLTPTETVYHSSMASNSSLLTEDLSDESPKQAIESPTNWYLLSEDETTTTNKPQPESSRKSGFTSYLKQLFPIACAVPDLSTISEMSKENDDSRKHVDSTSRNKDS